MKKILVIGLILIGMMATGCETDQVDKGLVVGVSIIPQKAFVEAVAGDLADVVVMIPPGASPSNYQPSPREMEEMAGADIYFSIGVPTEAGSILPAVEEAGIKIIDLNKIVSEYYPVRYFKDEDDGHEEDDGEEEHDHEGADPHIWLSPRRVVIMVETIKNELIALDPDHRDIYIKNAEAFNNQLESVDEDLRIAVEAMDKKDFIIMHPSLGYLADDYGLTMTAIEEDGKQSTSAHLQEVIDYAKGHEIKTIFYQVEFDSNQAETIAEEINGKVVQLDTLSEDYIANLKRMIEALELQ